VNDRVPWQSLDAYVFEITHEQAEYGTHIVKYPFAVQMGLPEGPEIWHPEMGHLTTQGDTPNDAICRFIKALTLLDYRGEIIFYADDLPAFGTVDFRPEKPKVRISLADVSDYFGFSPQDHIDPFIE